jgi:hypothetical protein
MNENRNFFLNFSIPIPIRIIFFWNCLYLLKLHSLYNILKYLGNVIFIEL